MSFEELNLQENLLEAVRQLGFETPMPIQQAVIPYILENDGDLIALAQTGTGKTAAYGLPLLQKITPGPTQVLILCPTRELCLQIADDLSDFAKFMDGIRILPVYGGTIIRTQIEALRKGVTVIVATPGRLIDLMERGCVNLSSIRYVVMDEADEMLDMGFSEDINTILASVPSQRNLLLFSATMPAEVEKVTKSFMNNPKEIVIGNKNESTASVRHISYMVQAKDKYLTLKRIVDFYPRIYGIVFCRTKAETQEISDRLIRDGYNVDALHGDLSQAQRDYVMQRFRCHNIQLLVATDVAARGLDVDDLTHVINYTLPDENEVYTHRSGRTGRAGRTGISIAIINLREKKRIKQIEQTINKTFEVGKIPTGKEICSKQIFSLADRIEKVEVDEEEIAELLPSVFKKLEWLNKEELVKRIVALEFNKILRYYHENEDFETVSEPQKRDYTKEPIATEEGYTKLFLTIGKMDGFGPKDILNMLNSCIGGKAGVGRIDLFTRYCLMDIETCYAKKAIDELSRLHLRGRILRASIATEEQMNRGTKTKIEAKSSDRKRKRNKHNK